nr:immunoglobulin heavy chain junction region [Mus musculus]
CARGTTVSRFAYW